MKTHVRASLLFACVWLASPFSAYGDSAGRVLLEHLMDKPGGWAQMCNPLDPTPFRPPVPVYSGKLIARYFNLGEKEAVLLQEKRSQVLPALVEAFSEMDLAKPPQVLRGFNDPHEGGGTHAGFKLNWLNPLHLKVVRELNAVETLPELLRLEAQLHTLLEAADKDPAAPLPPLDVDASLMPVKPGEKRETFEIIKSPEFNRDRQILTGRIFQSELLGTITVLLRNEGFAPAREKLDPLERETKARVLKETREAVAQAERSLADAKKNNPGEEEMKDRRYHLLEANQKLDLLQKEPLDAGFEAALTPALRTEIRTLAESFLKTVPPEKRRGAMAMPNKTAPATVTAPNAPPQRQGPNEHLLVMVPAGEYGLGADGVRTNPEHTVSLKAFAIAETETTNAQFAAFVKATNYKTSAEKDGDGGMVFQEGMEDWKWNKDPNANWRRPFGEKGPKAEDQPTYPVTQISGADAVAYCKWLGARLPALDEWEAAARAGAETKYPWGPDYDPKRANIWNGPTHRADTRLDGFLYTSPVKSFPPNAWGLYDVIGNVFEYCADLPPWMNPEDSRRLISGRGGSWWCSAGTCSFFNLQDIGSMARQGSLANQGFRVVFDAEKAAAFPEVKAKVQPKPADAAEKTPPK